VCTRYEASHHKSELHGLHKNYLLLYFLLKLADWLQGTNMYTLYLSYGVDIGTLFMTGFVTSAICGTFIGYLVDRFGRKAGCLVYIALEMVIQILEHYNNFTLLFIGRIMGGVSTALLFSAFESWIVTAHKKKRYEQDVLAKTFAIASTLNGVAAVLAGLIAKLSWSYLGEIGPFQVSLVITFFCGVFILLHWEENYGTFAPVPGKLSNEGDNSISLWQIFLDPHVFVYALVQAGFEGAMFTFVFMWVPALFELSKDRPPTELLFSCLMVSISIGGQVFELCADAPQPLVGIVICGVAAACMLLSAMVVSDSSHIHWLQDYLDPSSLIFLAFCTYEACVGVFDPWSSTMRSIYVPEHVQASVMTISRIPLNIIVGCGVYLTNHYSLATVFLVLCGIYACCVTLLCTQMVSREPKHIKTE